MFLCMRFSCSEFKTSSIDSIPLVSCQWNDKLNTKYHITDNNENCTRKDKSNKIISKQRCVKENNKKNYYYFYAQCATNLL